MPGLPRVKHLYRTAAVARERNDPSIYQVALDHLPRVNGWNSEQVRAHLRETREVFERREALGPG